MKRLKTVNRTALLLLTATWAGPGLVALFVAGAEVQPLKATDIPGTGIFVGGVWTCDCHQQTNNSCLCIVS